MTLDEAIIHCDEVAKACNNKQCSLDHLQLKTWLEELKELKSKSDNQSNYPTDTSSKCGTILINFYEDK